jgi:hypothetical protein
LNSAVEFKDVDILFASVARDGRKALREALAALDGGASRADLQKKAAPRAPTFKRSTASSSG